MSLFTLINKHIDLTLKKDLEYVVSATEKTHIRRVKRYIRYRVKQVLPGWLTQCIRIALWRLYFSYHYFRPWHLVKKMVNRLNREHYIAIHGGFGDLLLIYPFFRRWKQKHPKQRLIAVYHDDEKQRFKTTAGWKPIKLQLPNGEKINPLKDFLSSSPHIDEIRPGDVWDDGYDYWFPPLVAHRFGGYYSPRQYQDLMLEIFTQDDIEYAESFWERHRLESSFVVALHFRTSIECVYDLYERVQSYKQMQDHLRFLLLGSTSHEEIPIDRIRSDDRLIDLTNNYSKGITIRRLLAICKRADLFLGGRGGFDLFFWLAMVPTINIFDLQGRGELQKLWPRFLWEENYFPKLFWNDSFDGEAIFREYIEPYFRKWLDKNPHPLPNCFQLIC